MVIIIYSIRWWFDDFLNEHIVYIIYLILLRILYDDHFRSENKGVGIPHLWTKSGWDLLDSDSRVGHDNHPFCLDAHVHTKHKQQWSISPTCRILQMVRYGLLLRPFSNMFFSFCYLISRRYHPMICSSPSSCWWPKKGTPPWTRARLEIDLSNELED